MKLSNNRRLIDRILKEYDQIKIFSHYLGIPESEIQKCLVDRRYSTLNLHRGESNPSLKFLYTDNKVIAKDFANSLYTGDLISVIGRVVLNKNSNNPKEFVEICNHIINKNYLKPNNTKQLLPKTKIKSIEEMTPLYRSWNNEDYKYWTSSLFIPISFLESKYIFPIERGTYNDKIIYSYRIGDPAYCYYLGKVEDKKLYKFYYPLRTKENNLPRFNTNNIYNFEYIHEIKKNRNLILIKSAKDKILSEYIIKHKLPASFFPYGELIDIIPISSESIKLRHKQIKSLNSIYDNIIAFIDNDTEGNNFANYHKEKYNIESIMLGKGEFEKIKHKDISDHVSKTRNLNNGIKIIIKIINKYMYE